MIRYRDRSLVFKQSFWVLSLVALVLLGTALFFGSWGYRMLCTAYEQAGISAAQNAARRFDRDFVDAQSSTQLLARLIGNQAESDDFAEENLRATLTELRSRSRQFIGLTAAFADGKSYMVRFNDDTSMVTIRNPNIYYSRTWYSLAVALKRGVWSDPYFDPFSGMNIASYSLPVYRWKDGKPGKLLGVLRLDMELAGLREELRGTSYLANGYAFLVSKYASIIAHPESGLDNNYTLFNLFEEEGSELVAGRKAGRAIISGDSGSVRLDRKNGENLMLYYSPLPSSDWVLVLAQPARAVWHILAPLGWTALGAWLIALLLIWEVVSVVTRRMTRPLVELAEVAAQIGQGHFNVKVPAYRGGDEVGTLARALGDMQHALTKYMTELEQTTAQRERLEGELDVARTIQGGILPKMRLPHAEFKLGAVLKPARGVGGDLYDFFFLDENHLALVIGDVSGKGIPAALFMVVTQTLQRSVAHAQMSMGEIVSELNAQLGRDNDAMLFVTYWLGVLDIRTGELAFANAGHNPPVVRRRDGTIAELTQLHGAPLAVMDDSYSGDAVRLQDGDTLVLYTDGITEAFNRHGEEFGDDRLRQVVEASGDMEPKELADHLVKSVQQFADGAEQSDDITVLILQYLGKHDQA